MFTQGKSIQRTLLLSLLGVLWLLAAGWLALSTHVHQRDHLDEIDHRARDTIQLLAGHNTAGVTLEDSLRAMAQAATERWHRLSHQHRASHPGLRAHRPAHASARCDEKRAVCCIHPRLHPGPEAGP